MKKKNTVQCLGAQQVIPSHQPTSNETVDSTFISDYGCT